MPIESVQQTAIPGQSEPSTGDGIVGEIGDWIDSAASGIDSFIGDGDGKLTVGSTEISGDSFEGWLNDLFSEDSGTTTNSASKSPKTPLQALEPKPEKGLISTLDEIGEALGLDRNTMLGIVSLTANLGDLSTEQTDRSSEPDNDKRI